MDSAIFGIVGSFVGVLGAALGAPGIIRWMLERKNANKKLELEGDALSMTKFNALLGGYERRAAVQDGIIQRQEAMLATQSADIADLKDISERQNEAIADLQKKDREKQEELDDARFKLALLRELFAAFLNRTGTSFTPEEREIFERTIPRHPVTGPIPGVPSELQKPRSYKPIDEQDPA